MRLPKKFSSMSNAQQREWVAEKLRIVRKEEEELTKLLRLLVRDEKLTIKVDERPDEMK